MRRLFILMVVASLFCGCELVFADPGVHEILIAVIGEAADQSLEGQIAIVCGIRNRPEGALGIYGADMTRKPSGKEVERAVAAFKMASPGVCTSLIHGADMWHSNYPPPESWLGVPMIFIIKIEDHYFYRRLTQ